MHKSRSNKTYKSYKNPGLPCKGRGIDLSEVEMKTQEELKKMSFMELNAELQKAVAELGRELKALGILREVEKWYCNKFKMS